MCTASTAVVASSPKVGSYCPVAAVNGCSLFCALLLYLVHTGTVPAAQLAVDRINNDSRILPEYYLQLQAGYDSKVSMPPLWTADGCVFTPLPPPVSPKV